MVSVFAEWKFPEHGWPAVFFEKRRTWDDPGLLANWQFPGRERELRSFLFNILRVKGLDTQ